MIKIELFLQSKKCNESVQNTLWRGVKGECLTIIQPLDNEISTL